MLTNSFAFVLVLGVGFTAAFIWAFKTLPGERWQVIAAYPYQKGPDGSWLGRNLTYYGLFVAAAVVMGVATCFFLLGSMAMPASGLLLLVSLLLSICVPASKLVARWVERKQAVLTIGGASFLGMALAPACIGITNALLERLGHGPLPMLPTLASLAIAYGLGEGAGRLGCISFGCCYGKPLMSYQGIMSGLFARFHFIFTGRTKKVAYEAGLEHQPLIPIQAVTAMIYVGSSLLGMYWFLSGSFRLAFLEVMVFTQGWRVLSEFLRADHRGREGFTAYQWMALTGALYGIGLAMLLPDLPARRPDISTGLASLWTPSMILFLELLGVVIFLYTGRSLVTRSTISFHLVRERT